MGYLRLGTAAKPPYFAGANVADLGGKDAAALNPHIVYLR